MKNIAAALALSAALAACATPYAPQEFDFSELDSLPATAFGTVEDVREVRAGNALPFEELFAHSVRPDTGLLLLIRLDDGRAVRVMPQAMQAFEPGERVRLFGQRIERE